MNVFYETLNNIDSKKVSRERSLGSLGVKLSQTDLPQGYSETAPLPPFTLFYAPTINNGKLTEDVKWPEIKHEESTNFIAIQREEMQTIQDT